MGKIYRDFITLLFLNAKHTYSPLNSSTYTLRETFYFNEDFRLQSSYYACLPIVYYFTNMQFVKCISPKFSLSYCEDSANSQILTLQSSIGNYTTKLPDAVSLQKADTPQENFQGILQLNILFSIYKHLCCNSVISGRMFSHVSFLAMLTVKNLDWYISLLFFYS